MLEASNLDHFVAAQEEVYESVCAELKAGKKSSHWMWFVFPQLEGLGQSAMARQYAIHSSTEALQYLHHPVLGPRILECTALMLAIKSKSAFEILGTPDDLKFKSCMTLFMQVANGEPAVFEQALTRFYEGKPDKRTLELLARKPSTPADPGLRQAFVQSSTSG
jgi:uncharacterized protein (DUF1810 family)